MSAKSALHSSIAESTVQYNRKAKQWENWSGDYNELLLIGGVVAFPAGIEGKRGAMLSALTHDEPGLAAEVEALIQNRPELTDRAIRAGFIVKSGVVELLHFNHYRIQSQSRPETKWIVSYFDTIQGWNCGCEDWQNGNVVASFGWTRRSFAPFVNGIGPSCKHVLACILFQAITPYEPCPECEGKCYTSLNGHDGNWPTTMTLCAECDATGASLADPHIDMAYYEEKVQSFDEPMSYEDKPLSDDAYHELQELHREMTEEAYR